MVQSILCTNIQSSRLWKGDFLLHPHTRHAHMVYLRYLYMPFASDTGEATQHIISATHYSEELSLVSL
jgi:hypothetical protein